MPHLDASVPAQLHSYTLAPERFAVGISASAIQDQVYAKAPRLGFVNTSRRYDARMKGSLVLNAESYASHQPSRLAFSKELTPSMVCSIREAKSR